MPHNINASLSENVKAGVSLPLMEHFYSLQGEGYHAGTAAYFIRLAGCDVGCSWCDVKESWDAAVHPVIPVEELKDYVLNAGANFCVVTGGEPATYILTDLVDKLRENNIYSAIETSGVYPLTGNWHWVCFSPKKFKAPDPEIYTRANELKVIVYNKHDFIFAEEHASKVNKDCVLFLQPEWSKSEQLLPQIIDYVRQNPKWRLSLQTHKYLNIP